LGWERETKQWPEIFAMKKNKQCSMTVESEGIRDVKRQNIWEMVRDDCEFVNSRHILSGGVLVTLSVNFRSSMYLLPKHFAKPKFDRWSLL
jgi:hypothetical protein